MGRRSAGSCRCNGPLPPLAVGVPYTLWKTMCNGIRDWVANGQGHLDGANATQFIERVWKVGFPLTGNGTHYIMLQPVESDILDKDYFGSKGWLRSPLDAVLYGTIPGWKDYFRRSDNYHIWPDRVYVPLAGTEEHDKLLTYLSRGGILIVDALAADYSSYNLLYAPPQDRPRYVAHYERQVAMLNTFLASIGSTVSLKTRAEMMSTLGLVEGQSIKPVMTKYGAYAFNPDTWLTAGLDLCPRITSQLWTRWIYDANRQNGFYRTRIIDANRAYYITDTSGGGDAGIEYFEPENASFIYRRHHSRFLGRSSFGNYNGIPGVFLATTESANILCSVPLAKADRVPPTAAIPPSTPSYALYDTPSIGTRHNYITATAETIPNGGRVIVSIDTIVAQHYDDNYSYQDQSMGSYLMLMLKRKIQPMANYVQRGLYDSVFS